MSAEAAQARVAGWLAPIPGGAPAGSDARYDPLHEQIRAEAAKLDSPLGGLPDWAKLVRQAEQLTSQKSKDLLIQSYAAYGLYQTQGLLGLASGLFLLAESMDQYWDGMQPPAARIRARVNAIQWLTERLDTTLSSTAVGPADHGAIEALEVAAKRLRSVVSDKFVDSAPALRPLIETIERLKMSLPEAPEGPSDTEPPPRPASAGTPAPLSAPAQLPQAASAPPEASSAPPAAAPPAAAAPAVDLAGELAAAAAPYAEPIPGPTPAGIDAKYDPDHEELRNVVASLDSPTGGQIDWKKVAPKAGTILRHKSKDLLVAAYFTWGMFELDRLKGLALGLEVISQLCERYWDDCFPPVARVRGRANALSWLLDRLEQPLPSVPLTAADKHAVDLLEVSVKRFASVVRDKFEDAAPSVRPLLDNVQRLKMAVPEPAPAPVAAPPPAAQPAPAPKAAAPAAAAPTAAAPAAAVKPAAAVSLGEGPAAAMADPKEVGKFATAVGKSLLDAAKVLREAAPADPTSYTFVRLGLALGVALPPAQGAETKVPPPPAPAVKDLEIAVQNQAWDQVITKSELALVGKRFWLDLHRYTAMALANLGRSHEKAHAAALAGTALWVKLYPELLDLSFAGGMPFASPVTREWIQAEVMPSGGGGGASDTSEGAEALAQARALVGGGKMDEALGVLEGVVHGARSGRARFRARLAMAQALASGATASAAEAMFDVLLQDIDAMGLEAWEPELAADCLRSHLGCLKALKKPNDPQVSQQSALVYRRLCRVDPLGALKVGG